MSNRVRRSSALAPLIHAARVALVIALMLAIPSPATQSLSDSGVAPSNDQLNLQSLAPEPDGQPWQVQSEPNADQMWPVRDAAGNTVAWVARTLPAAEEVVGYRGPTEAAIVLDNDDRVLAVRLLHSADTHEHVDAVLADDAFLQQFVGWQWGAIPADDRVDAVSGATLTSLALAEGVIVRMGGERSSLVFGQAVTADELQGWFPEAAQVTAADALITVADSDGKPLGRVLRSGPLSDDVIGYQGPTELLLQLTDQNEVAAIRIRSSLDNEPYVDYVRTERGFWTIFEDQSIAQLAAFDPEAAGVEGVSGATMTSLAVADTIVAAAQAAQQKFIAAQQPPPRWWDSLRLTTADLATLAALIMAVLARRLGWFGNHRWRRLWLLAVIGVIGLWAGNLISMALVAGWSAEGIPWRLAPGLAVIAVTALLMPPLTKANPYCNHLCPHGAVQQLVKPGFHSSRKWHPPRRLAQVLRWIPGVMLVVAYLALVAIPSVDLASWEPFHAYLFRIAGWGSIALAVGSLVFAAFVPMGYCRMGCPTGRLIEYLRRTAHSDRITLSDGVAMALLVIAIGVRGWA